MGDVVSGYNLVDLSGWNSLQDPLFDIATASVFVCHTAYCSVVLFMLLQLVCVVNHVLQYVSLLPGHLPDSPQETQPKLWTIPLL